MAAVNYVLSPFEGNINPWDPTDLKLYIQGTKQIDKETYKLYISVSNFKDIVDHFLSLDNKCGWGGLAFMVNTGADTNKIFRVVEQIFIEEIQYQARGYIGLLRIVNYVSPLPITFKVRDLTHLSDNCGTLSVEIKKFFDRVHSYMIYN